MRLSTAVKWHLGFFQHAYLPTKRGFDSFYGFLSDQENYYDREYPYPIGDVYYKDWMSISEDDESKMDVLESVDESGEYSLDLMLTHAESKISRHNSKESLLWSLVKASCAPN